MPRSDYKAWYRKYRSRNLSELVGQTHISRALANAIKNNQINHAYLFAGARGIGKTSTARIFASLINNLETKNAESHLDIIEIDAASNRRIDEIRDLREKIHIAPTSAQYKVYIIDEAHMLTTEAFNALLKTLEEPPSHVVFILATTEPHKLPTTIISRTQVFNFTPIAAEQIVAHLAKIANAEKVTFDMEALELIAQAAAGSLRDGIGMLEQLATIVGNKRLTAAEASSLLGLSPLSSLATITLAIANGAPDVAIKKYNELQLAGAQPSHLLHQFLKYWQGLIKIHLNVSTPNLAEDAEIVKLLSKKQLLRMLSALIELPRDSDYLNLLLEAKILELSFENSPPPAETQKHAGIEPITSPSQTLKKQSTASAKKESAPTKNKQSITATDWEKVLTYLKTHHSSLYTLLKLAEPMFEGDVLKLGFRFQFHKRRLEEARNRDALAKVILKITKRNMQIEATLIETSQLPGPTPVKDNQAINDVLKVLGGEIIK